MLKLPFCKRYQDVIQTVPRGDSLTWGDQEQILVYWFQNECGTLGFHIFALLRDYISSQNVILNLLWWLSDSFTCHCLYSHCYCWLLLPFFYTTVTKKGSSSVSSCLWVKLAGHPSFLMTIVWGSILSFNFFRYSQEFLKEIFIELHVCIRKHSIYCLVVYSVNFTPI